MYRMLIRIKEINPATLIRQVFEDKRSLNRLIIFSLLARLLLFLTDGHDLDFEHFESWAESMVRYGFVNVYTHPINGFDCDYPALYHYILASMGHLFTWLGLNIHSHLFDASLKFINLIIEYSFIFFVHKKLRNNIFTCLLLLSPATIINAYGWGQVDIIFAILLFCCIYFLIENQLIKASVFLALSLCMKSQTLLFMPIIGLLFLLSSSSVMSKIESFALFIFVVFLVNFPFIFFADNPLISLEPHYTAAGRYNNISVNAFNIYWGFFADYSLYQIEKFPPNDVLIFGILSRKILAYSVFAAIYSFVLIYLLIMKRNKERIYSLLTFFCFSFFMFLPEMHERYLFPFFLFSAFLASYKPKEIKYFAIISALHLINLLWGWGGQYHLTSEFFFMCTRIVGFLTFIAWCMYARETYFRLYKNNSLEHRTIH